MVMKTLFKQKQNNKTLSLIDIELLIAQKI